jgi:carbamoyltransferase
MVNKDINYDYYSIIKGFQKNTGKKSGLLNTSFNLHGYPIVSSPIDALDVFDKSGLRYIAVNNYLIEKTG